MNHLSHIETSVRAAPLALLSGGAPLSIDSRMRLPNFSLIEAVRRLLDLIACKIQSLAEVCFEVRITLRVSPLPKN
jgi:hypothetical protein